MSSSAEGLARRRGVDNESRSKTDTAEMVDAQTKSNAAATRSPIMHRNVPIFGGPLGTLFLAFFLPTFLLFVAITSADYSNLFLWSNYQGIWPYVAKRLPDLEMLFDPWAVVQVWSWLIGNLLLYRFLPGEVVDGQPIKNYSYGRYTDPLKPLEPLSPLKYKLNGHLQFWLTHFFFLTCGMAWNWKSRSFQGMTWISLTDIVDDPVGLTLHAIIVSFGLATFLYIWSFRSKGVVLRHDADLHGFFYDFFMGRELNPRIGHWIDLKIFLDLRPSLIGWSVLNIAFLQGERAIQGRESYEIIALCFTQGIYVFDALFNERCMLSTMDITDEGLGLMLCFGNIAFVPLMYSLPAQMVMRLNGWMNVPQIALSICIFFIGYMIFRLSNLQKDTYRRDPTSNAVKHLKVLKTARGTDLLISGWFGWARKINYTGDIIMGLSWVILAGFDGPWNIFYLVYIIILLGHRAIRDDAMCQRKYGKDWVEYKKIVPYIFIPYIF